MFLSHINVSLSLFLLPSLKSINMFKKEKEKAFDKIHYPFMTKTPSKLRNRRDLSQPDKGHLGKTHSQYHT